jgi:hypothetical protein
LKQACSNEAQAVPEGLPESVCLPEKSDWQVADEGGKDLNPDRIVGTPQELLDPEMLLDPLEE